MICYIYRKREPIYFSIEKIFDEIAEVVAGHTKVTQARVPQGRLSPRNVLLNLQFMRTLKAAE